MLVQFSALLAAFLIRSPSLKPETISDRDPVCGCDSMTYSNSCGRLTVNVASDGPC